MNRDAIPAAEERLLDAALAQLFAAAPRAAVPARNPRLVAVLLLLGVAVTAASMWLARPAPPTAAQEPAPLPPEVEAEGRSAVLSLPRTTQNLRASVLQPDDVAAIARLPELRRLSLRELDVRIGPIRTHGHHPGWQRPTADLLAPLTDLPRLEVLELPGTLAVTPAVLAPLARCALLRHLGIGGLQLVVDDALVAALRAIPRLHSLHLTLVRVDAEAMARLATLPLTDLELWTVPGFDAAAWRELCRMRSLRRLSAMEFGRIEYDSDRNGNRLWRPGPDDLRRLADLPALQALELYGCDLRDEDVLALPDTLVGLVVHGHALSPDGLSDLRRFGRLRTLDITTRTASALRRDHAGELADAEAIAAALGALRLHTLRYRVGPFAPGLRAAVADQPDLRELAVFTSRFDGLDELARAPSLQRIELAEIVIPSGFTPELLAPLRDCRSLRQVVLHTNEHRGRPGLEAAAVRTVVGEQVDVQVHRQDFAAPR